MPSRIKMGQDSSILLSKKFQSFGHSLLSLLAAGPSSGRTLYQIREIYANAMGALCLTQLGVRLGPISCSDARTDCLECHVALFVILSGRFIS